jgi:hypothetical protein
MIIKWGKYFLEKIFFISIMTQVIFCYKLKNRIDIFYKKFLLDLKNLP